MNTYHGKSVFGGIAIGTAVYIKHGEYSPKKHRIYNTDDEIRRFYDACAKTQLRLESYYKSAIATVGSDGAAIFEAHKMIVSDPEFCEMVCHNIRSELADAAYSVMMAKDAYLLRFNSYTDPCIKERLTDIIDVSDQLIESLTDNTVQNHFHEINPVIIADELTPRDTICLNQSEISAFVTEHGCINSHASILARSIGVPTVLQIPVSSLWNGHVIIVDGDEGTVTLDPDAATLQRAQERLESWIHQQKSLLSLKGTKSMTKSGCYVNLYANMNNLSDLPMIIENDAEGIGLFRSEYLYLQSADLPSEEMQFQAYKKAATSMNGKNVVIRTQDMDAEKQAVCLHLPTEANPALGYRAIRISLTQKEMFKVQLRAILRAAAFGNLSVMFPMITSIGEIIQIKSILKEAQDELMNEHIPSGSIRIGIMIETPAAAIISDLLAKEVDFFSIGTNDLTQYTLALDRRNSSLETFLDPHHEAILRMIRMVIENGHREGINVGICGELAADLKLTESFVTWGIDSLSVSPALIPLIRQKIQSLP